MLSPRIKLSIASELLSLNDKDLILINGIINDIKTNKYKKELYRAVEELEYTEIYCKGGLVNDSNKYN